jgi:large subunit ribosomal protein L43
LTFHYCDWYGSSKGMNTFLSSPLLTQFTHRYPSTEFRISPRPNKHPVIKAHYINGREKSVCVRGLEKEQILAKAEFLVGNSGEKNRRVGTKKVLSGNESVRGVWSPMHGGIKAI